MDSQQAAQLRSYPVNDLASTCFAKAREVFLRDGYHDPMTFVLKGSRIVWYGVMPAKDQDEKDILIQQLADYAYNQSADGILLINEAWISSADSFDQNENPNDAPDREEVLCISVATKVGPFYQLMATIERNGDSLQLGETTLEDTGVPHLLEPLYDMWRQQRPTKINLQFSE